MSPKLLELIAPQMYISLAQQNVLLIKCNCDYTHAREWANTCGGKRQMSPKLITPASKQRVIALIDSSTHS